MKNLLLILIFAILPISIKAQTTVKLNSLYALVGVINPAIEIPISDKVSFQSELVISPWKSISWKGKEHPMLFGFLINEFRYYFREKQNGWYAAGNFGLGIIHMSKPKILETGKFEFDNRYSKGWSMMVGFGGGYQTSIGGRWRMDIYAALGWMLSYYNGYSLDGEIQMHPPRPVPPKYPDPWNASGEWMPYKLGVSFGYKLFDK